MLCCAALQSKHSVLTLGGGGVALLAGELCRGSQFPVYISYDQMKFQ